MYPVPQVSDLAAFSGRPEATYTSYANSALLQATIRFSFLTEVTDPASFTGYNQLSADDQRVLALQGICALADSIYLQFPYQQSMASPMNSETIGSYSYAKTIGQGPGGSLARVNANALELSLASTGIPIFDMAVQLLALRTIAAGVFHGGMSMFEDGERRAALGAIMVHEGPDGRRAIVGPGDENLINFPFDVNGESFPMDPGI